MNSSNNSRNPRNRNHRQDETSSRIIAALLILAGIIVLALVWVSLENAGTEPLPEPGAPETKSATREVSGNMNAGKTAPDPVRKSQKNEALGLPETEAPADPDHTDSPENVAPEPSEQPAPPEPAAAPEAPSEPLVCDSRDSCYRTGQDLYKSGNTRDALPYLTAGCRLNHRESCYLAGLIGYAGHITYEEAAEFLIKGCRLNHGESCLSLEDLVSKRFPDNAEMKQNARKLRNEACNRGTVKACRESSSGKGTSSGVNSRNSSRNHDGSTNVHIVRHYSSTDASDIYGCGELVFESCFEVVADAVENKKRIPFGMHEWRILEDSCTKFNIGRGCRLYAEKFREDDTKNINYKRLLSRKQLYLDKACHLLGDAATCNKAMKFRSRYDRIYDKKKATEQECMMNSVASCLKRGLEFENNGNLAPEIRTWKAAQIYEELCLRGDSDGCLELRRLNVPWWPD